MWKKHLFYLIQLILSFEFSLTPLPIHSITISKHGPLTTPVLNVCHGSIQLIYNQMILVSLKGSGSLLLIKN